MSSTGSFNGPGMDAYTSRDQAGYAGVPPRRSTSGLAITTLVLGVAGFLVITIPLNLILGLVAIARTGRRRQKGRGLAVTGLILSVLWAVGIGIGVAALLRSPDPERDASGQVSKAQAAGPDKLRVGDCVAGIGDGEVTNVRVQPCGRPGGDKVYATFELPKKAWAGTTATNAAAEKGCTTRYSSSGRQAAKEAQLSYLGPTETRWKLGYRRVVCLVGPAS
jgi:hypothetical protein